MQQPADDGEVQHGATVGGGVADQLIDDGVHTQVLGDTVMDRGGSWSGMMQLGAILSLSLGALL